MKQDSKEFQAAAHTAGEAVKNMIVELMRQNDQTPNTIISGAIMAICTAQISMRPNGMDADKAVLMLLGTVAASCAQIVNALDDKETEN